MKQLDSNNFKKEIESSKLTMVDFYASWCFPCKMLTPIIEELEEEMHEKVNFAKADVDNLEEISAKLGIMAVPTIILFKNGEEVDRTSGLQSKDELKKIIQENL